MQILSWGLCLKTSLHKVFFLRCHNQQTKNIIHKKGLFFSSMFFKLQWICKRYLFQIIKYYIKKKIQKAERHTPCTLPRNSKSAGSLHFSYLLTKKALGNCWQGSALCRILNIFFAIPWWLLSLSLTAPYVQLCWKEEAIKYIKK